MNRYFSLMNPLIVGILLLLASTQLVAQESGTYQVKNRVTWQAEWQLRSDNVSERERSTLWLSIISNQPISGLIKIEDLKVVGLFTEASDSPSYSHETRDGMRFYVSHYRYDIYPSRAGNYTLPELAITVTQGDKEQQFRSERFPLQVAALPRAAQGAISSSRYSLSQKVSKKELMSGGVVSRTVTQRSADLPGYLIAQLPPIASFDQNVTLTFGRETNTTEHFRGEVTGTKSSNIHYRFLEVGQYQLPAIEVTWWNNETAKLETETLAAIDIVVTAPPPLPLKERVAIIWFETTQQAPVWWAQNQHWVYGSFLFGLFIYFIRNKITKQLQRLKKRIKQAKKSAVYRCVKLSLSALKPQAIWQKAFYQWMRENNFSSLHGLPAIFTQEIAKYQQSNTLNKVNILICVVKWLFNHMKTKWNLTEINPK